MTGTKKSNRPVREGGDAGPLAILRCGTRSLDLSRTVVMGVLNVTPDSFSDGGRFQDPAVAAAHAEAMQREGAEIIDVGGESSRPGSTGISLQMELDRVIPMVELLRSRLDVVISVDTTKAEIMREVLSAGADMINDINALRSEGALAAVAESRAAVCLMHMLGKPRTMQDDPVYEDVVAEVRQFLSERAKCCTDAGIEPERIVVDPGFGFGKTVAHNLELLRNLARLDFGHPVMAGLSRKSMIGKVLGLGPGRRLHAGVALALIAVQNGARLIRTHDVGPTCEAIRMYEAVLG